MTRQKKIKIIKVLTLYGHTMLLLAVLTSFPLVTHAQSEKSFIKAQEIFQKYIEHERNFSSAILGLFDDKASIINTRTYKNGRSVTSTIPMDQYKVLVLASLPIEKQRGDSSAYSNTTYTEEDNKIRIHTNRFSTLKNYTSPMSLLVGPNQNEEWVIFEEVSESRE